MRDTRNERREPWSVLDIMCATTALTIYAALVAVAVITWGA